MDFPLLLLALLSLPIVVAALIVTVSVGRRRGRTPADATSEPEHRLQAGTAAVQDAAVHPAPVAPAATSARQRRAESGVRPNSG